MTVVNPRPRHAGGAGGRAEFANMSHELRTPLIGVSEMLREDAEALGVLSHSAAAFAHQSGGLSKTPIKPFIIKNNFLSSKAVVSM